MALPITIYLSFLSIISCDQLKTINVEKNGPSPGNDNSEKIHSEKFDIVTDTKGLDVKFELVPPMTVTECKVKVTITNLSEDNLRFIEPNGNLSCKVFTSKTLGGKMQLTGHDRDRVGYSSRIVLLEIGDTESWLIDLAKVAPIQKGKNFFEIHIQAVSDSGDIKGGRSLNIQIKNILVDI